MLLEAFDSSLHRHVSAMMSADASEEVDGCDGSSRHTCGCGSRLPLAFLLCEIPTAAGAWLLCRCHRCPPIVSVHPAHPVFLALPALPGLASLHTPGVSGSGCLAAILVGLYRPCRRPPIGCPLTSNLPYPCPECQATHPPAGFRILMLRKLPARTVVSLATTRASSNTFLEVTLAHRATLTTPRSRLTPQCAGMGVHHRIGDLATEHATRCSRSFAHFGALLHT